MIAKSFTKAIKGISFITTGVFSLFTLTASAQFTDTLFNNFGAVVYVNTGGVMYVDGGLRNHSTLQGDSILVNLGTLIVKQHLTNDGLFGGSPGSFIPPNNGHTIVGGNWRNNGDFNSGIGKVTLDGDTQYLTGVVPTSFYDLELLGTGTALKIQTINQFVTNNLDLTDRELWTDKYTMFVESTNPGAIIRTTGFVSSLEDGSLSRRMEGFSDYLFPVGSTQGQDDRYRPAKIAPTTSLPNRFTVRLVNADPNVMFDPSDYAKPTSAHDETVCYVNDNYWYKIMHPEGVDNADLSLSYDAAFAPDQGAYNGLVQWDSITDNRWENLGTTQNLIFPNGDPTGDPNDPATLLYIRKNAVNNFAPKPFTLAYFIPPAPITAGADVICADVVTTYSIHPNTNGSYEFYTDSINGVPTGVIVGTTDTSVTVIWNDMGAGIIHVIETIDNQNGYVSCPSLIGSFAVDILALPHAIFGTVNEYPNPNPNGTYNYNNPNDVFVNDLISFRDSSTNTVSWDWTFGDNSGSVHQNPYHTYGDIGTFNVMMVATSPDGCLDTAYKDINVVEGIIVSNVFTPNGDGYNDVFKIRNSNVSEFTFRVFNRWGTQIFETTAPEIAWDGKTSAGSVAPAGTYFYTLKAKLASGNDIAIFQSADDLDKGTITLIR